MTNKQLTWKCNDTTSHNTKAVSYTHLDVYKRQVLRHQRDEFHGIFPGKGMSSKESGAENPRRKFVTKLAFHYEEGVSRARLGRQIETIQSVAALLEDYERERYYRRSRQGRKQKFSERLPI